MYSCCIYRFELEVGISIIWTSILALATWHCRCCIPGCHIEWSSKENKLQTFLATHFSYLDHFKLGFSLTLLWTLILSIYVQSSKSQLTNRIMQHHSVCLWVLQVFLQAVASSRGRMSQGFSCTQCKHVDDHYQVKFNAIVTAREPVTCMQWETPFDCASLLCWKCRWLLA